MADGIVQVLPDSTGKKVDTSELTRADGTVVERQRFVASDNSATTDYATAEVRGKKLQVGSPELQYLQSINDSLKQIVIMLEAALK